MSRSSSRPGLRLKRPTRSRNLPGRDYFSPHNLRVDLQERLIRQFVRDLVVHPLDIATFDAMLRSTRRVESAVHLYVEEFFPLATLIRAAADAFAEDGGFSSVMAYTAAIYLKSLFRRHILDREALLSPLMKLLRGRARDTGYIRSAAAGEDTDGSDRQASSHDGRAGDGLHEELRSARDLFDLKNDEITLSSIRQRYKQLIRKSPPRRKPGRTGNEQTRQCVLCSPS